MPNDSEKPLPSNTRVHPDPHKPQRGMIPIGRDMGEVPALLILEDGLNGVPYRVTYHRPVLAESAGTRLWDLSRCVATWERAR